MKNMIAKLGIAGGVLLAAFLLNGCALTKGYVAVTYVPQVNVSHIPGAEAVTLKVEVVDLRSTKDKVSSKKNGYGMETAPILAENDVSRVLRRAIETELEERGFNVGGGSVQVVAELSKFYNDFKIGFWAGDAVAEVTMNVQVKKPDGSIAYSKLIAGEGIEPNILLASEENAQASLNAALHNAIFKLFEDPAFIDSLLKSGSTAQLQAGLIK